MFLTPVTEEEVIKCTTNLPNKHAASCDGLSVFIVKKIICNIANSLTKIINNFAELRCCTSVLQNARIVLIYKSGDTNDLKNYMPILVLPAISKIFEKLMLNKLLSFIEKHNILNNSQHGFRTKHNTVTANTDVIDYITHAIDNKLYTVGLFLDVSKAFETVNHDILLTNLDHYSFWGVVNSWLSSYLNNRHQYTVYDN